MSKPQPIEELSIEYEFPHNAHEESTPGTVNLQAEDGQRTIRGQALYPIPADDPNDPLNWPEWKKFAILTVCALYSFLANTTLIGPSVYISVWAKEFDVSPTKASELVNFPNLVFGFGSLLLVPSYLKFGRRPVMLGTLILYVASVAVAPKCTTYGSLMAARIVQALSSGVCEALPVQLINDVFFLNERGTRIGIYTICLALGGGLGPLAAGYMLNGGESWTLFFWVEFAFGALLLVIAFFIVEETRYNRPSSNNQGRFYTGDAKRSMSEAEQQLHHGMKLVPARKTFGATLRVFSGIDKKSEFWRTMVRSITYFFVPQVLWVITTYGIYIGLAGLAINFTFPIKITAAPYNWSQINSGLISLGNAVGYLLALPFSATSDQLAAYYTKRNGWIREAEFRLGVLLPAMLISPAGLLLYGMTAERTLHWFGYFAGTALLTWGAYFYFTFTLAYAVDSHNANISEMLIAMNLGKQAISFGLNYGLLSWIQKHGYASIICVAFVIILLTNNLMVIVFMIFGKRIRKWVAGTWLAALHKHTMVVDPGRGLQRTHNKGLGKHDREVVSNKKLENPGRIPLATISMTGGGDHDRQQYAMEFSHVFRQPVGNPRVGSGSGSRSCSPDGGKTLSMDITRTAEDEREYQKWLREREKEWAQERAAQKVL